MKQRQDHPWWSFYPLFPMVLVGTILVLLVFVK